MRTKKFAYYTRFSDFYEKYLSYSIRKDRFKRGFLQGNVSASTHFSRLFALTYPNGAPKRDEWVGFHCLFTHVTEVPAEGLKIWEAGKNKWHGICFILVGATLWANQYYKNFSWNRVEFAKIMGVGEQMPSCPSGSAGPDYYMPWYACFLSLSLKVHGDSEV